MKGFDLLTKDRARQRKVLSHSTLMWQPLSTSIKTIARFKALSSFSIIAIPSKGKAKFSTWQVWDSATTVLASLLPQILLIHASLESLTTCLTISSTSDKNNRYLNLIAIQTTLYWLSRILTTWVSPPVAKSKVKTDFCLTHAIFSSGKQTWPNTRENLKLKMSLWFTNSTAGKRMM